MPSAKFHMHDVYGVVPPVVVGMKVVDAPTSVGYGEITKNGDNTGFTVSVKVAVCVAPIESVTENITG